MEQKIRIGISSCLLGEKVRYDGGHKLDHFLTDTLGKYVDWIPVCPEVESGLPVPREAMRLAGDPSSPRLVTVKTGIDHTERILHWAEKKLRELERQDLCGFVFKSRSPSSGMRDVKVDGQSGTPSRSGVGVFAGAFMSRFPLMPVEDEGRLHDPDLRENFIERIFVFKRWKEFRGRGGKVRDLIAFHTDHKLLILSHSTRHYSALGQLVARAKAYKTEGLLSEYLKILMDGLRLTATAKKNTNVLQHMAGYFSERLSTDEKRELGEIISQYHAGLIPLVVPIVLMRHYVRKFNEPYLKRQHYLNTHPLELMLRNHV
ncbi:MAG TPA: DUF523 and DUF1722 domain-containing protein [Thermodesulfovibrionales bacterium]|nr:DUF523 and DUF1722 domain-containing protein [Thermodesulfovibrionales bacterium]